MAKRRVKKENPLRGQINFYKAMTVLGLIIAGTFIYYFLDSAPGLKAHPFHIPTDTAAKCMECHLGQNEKCPHHAAPPDGRLHLLPHSSGTRQLNFRIQVCPFATVQGQPVSISLIIEAWDWQRMKPDP